jgi:hypothetical protein
MENTLKQKHIEAVTAVIKRQNFHYEKGNFCREHNMKLDEICHQQIEEELRRLVNKLSDILDTGYISVENVKSE